MKSELLDSLGVTRNALVENIIGEMNNDRVTEALDIKNKNKRIDAIADIIREAALRCPLIILEGSPHTYVREIGCYQKVKWVDISDSIYVIMRRIGVKDGDYGRLDYMTKIVSRAISNRECDIDNTVVVMNNGVFDTMGRKFVPFSDRFITNRKVDYDYDELEECIAWRKFLDRVLPDKQLQNLLQEFVSACYIIRSKVKIEQMLILLGDGQNGKSVVFEVISALLGEDNVSHFYISELIGGNRREQNIYACKGKRLNYCSEIKTKEIDEDNADAIKSIISGEPVMGRKLFCEPETVTEFPLMMANANTLPRIKNPNNSLMRRILIIPFDVKISKDEQNLELANDLKKNLSGIFNWAMEGMERLRMNDFKINVPTSVRALVGDYMNENNPILNWLNQSDYSPRINVVERKMKMNWKTFRELYDEYVEWCGRIGERVCSQSSMVKCMKDAGYIHQRKTRGFGFSLYVPIETMLKKPKRATYDKTKSSISEEAQDILITGVPEVERYLGLPPDSITDYLFSGKLDGTYTRGKDGVCFNVQSLQSALSESGYFEMIRSKGFAERRYNDSVQVRRDRRVFNSDMKKRGLPFRKYSGSAVIPKTEKDCIVVPDGWRYSPENASIAVREYNENKIKYDKYGRECKD